MQLPFYNLTNIINVKYDTVKYSQVVLNDETFQYKTNKSSTDLLLV